MILSVRGSSMFLLNLFITNAIIADANAARMILPTSSEEPGRML
jgi:hypothetical protein